MNKIKRKIFSLAYSVSALVFGILLLPNSVFAITKSPPITKIPSPFTNKNLTLTGFLEIVLVKIVLPIGSIIAVIFIVYAGFLFVTARGNETQLGKAKKTLLWTVVGVAVLLGSVAISTGIKETICQIAPNIPSLCP